jgi:23S rRNA G2445 N2-methylase RlmL
MEEINSNEPVLIASDISSRALEAAQENLSRLELNGAVRLLKQDCLCFEYTSDKGLIISNLPYGKRVGASIELKEFYRRFGAHLRKKFNGWSFGFVVADKNFEKTAGLKIRKETGFVNGGIRVRFVTGKIV